jgi:hypothetical protein
MQGKYLLSLGLVSLTMAAQDAAMDAPAVKALMSTLNSGFTNVDKAIQAINEVNVATQVPTVVVSMDTLNKALIDGSARLKSSKALGILDMSSLSSSMSPIQKTMTSLLSDLIAKRPIIVRGNQVEALGQGLKKQQAGFMALQEAFMTQIPAAMAGQIPKGGAMPSVNSNIDGAKLEDLMYDVVLAVFKGTDTTVKVSGSIWPLPGGEVPKGASAPKSATTPKGAGASKGSKRSVLFRA